MGVGFCVAGGGGVSVGLIRISKIGYPCIRNVWYSANGLEEVIDQRAKRIFAMGHAVERLAVEWLAEDGWGVVWNPGSQDADVELRIPVRGGELVGHPDCLITDGRGWILADIKSMNSRAYKHWTQQGTVQNKLSYLCQVTMYAHALNTSEVEWRGLDSPPKVERVAIIGVNKDTSEYAVEVLEIDDAVTRTTIAKAEYILGAPNPPAKEAWEYPHLGVTSQLPGWCCSYCGYKKAGVCDGAKEGADDDE